MMAYTEGNGSRMCCASFYLSPNEKLPAETIFVSLESALESIAEFLRDGIMYEEIRIGLLGGLVTRAVISRNGAVELRSPEDTLILCRRFDPGYPPEGVKLRDPVDGVYI